MSNTAFYARNGLQVAPNTRMIIATGNTGQRPSSPVGGDFRFNSESGTYEVWYPANSSWSSLAGTFPTDPSFNSITVGNSTVNSFSNATYFRVGSNVYANATAFGVGNSTVNAFMSALGLQVGANVVVNSSGFGLGNSTFSMIANSTALKIGNTVLSASILQFTGGTVNSSWFTGTANQANNSAYLGGIAAGQYAFANQIPSGTSPGGSNTYVQFNSSGSFGGTIGLTWNFNSNTLFVSNAISLGGGATINSTSYTGTAATATSATSATSATNASNLGGQGPAYFLAFSNFSGTLGGGQFSSSTNYTGNILYAAGYHYSYGNIYAAGDVYAGYSDIRMKYIVGYVEGALDKIEKLQAIFYRRNPDVAPELGAIDNRVRIGLIAQDVQAVVPEVVSNLIDTKGKETEYLTVQYDRLVPLLIAAVQELNAEVKLLRSKIAG